MNALTEAVERLVALQERAERERHRHELREEWGSPADVPPRLDLGAFVRSIPGFAERFAKTVPDEYIERGETQVSVRCLCGAVTVTPRDTLVACECSRWFLNDGPHVHVAAFDA